MYTVVSKDSLNNFQAILSPIVTLNQIDYSFRFEDFIENYQLCKVTKITIKLQINNILLLIIIQIVSSL